MPLPWGRRALTRRVLAASVVLLALVLAAGAALWVTTEQLHRAQRFQDGQLGVATRAGDALLRAYVDEETGLRGYLLTGEPRFLAPYDEAQTTLPGTTATFSRHFAASGGPVALAQQLDAAHRSWLTYAHQQIALAGDGQLAQARSVAATSTGKTLFDRIRARDADVDGWLGAASERSAHRVATLQHRLVALLVTVLGTLLVLLAGSCAVLWRSVARPLARLAAATRSVAAGDLGADLPGAGALEVRSLATDVRAMRNRLTAELHTAQRGLEALQQTGPAVAALRAALEPLAEPVAGLAVAARLDPAEGVLAGDWYDAVALSPTRLALVLGDVAGHGPAAAVFALRLKHSLISALRAGLDPGQALTQVSGELADVPPGQFATALVAVLDTGAGTVTHANAGHPPALLVSSAGGPVGTGEDEGVLLLRGADPVSWRELPATGPLLSSIVLGWAWNTATWPFAPGDSLLAVTDGVLESRDGAGREFGSSGVLDAVAEAGLDDGRALIETIAAASMRFGGGAARRDDHTIVHVRRTAPERSRVATPR